MNKYDNLVNLVTDLAFGNHCMCVKLKYNARLRKGVDCDDPIYIEFEQEFEEFSYLSTRKIIRKNCKKLEDLQFLKEYFTEDNAIKDQILFSRCKIKPNNIVLVGEDYEPIKDCCNQSACCDDCTYEDCHEGCKIWEETESCSNCPHKGVALD